MISVVPLIVHFRLLMVQAMQLQRLPALDIETKEPFTTKGMPNLSFNLREQDPQGLRPPFAVRIPVPIGMMRKRGPHDLAWRITKEVLKRYDEYLAIQNTPHPYPPTPSPGPHGRITPDTNAHVTSSQRKIPDRNDPNSYPRFPVDPEEGIPPEQRKQRPIHPITGDVIWIE